MRRAALVVTFAAALAVGLSGCSSETPGNASLTEATDGGGVQSFPMGTPADDGTAEPSETGSGTASLKPCELLTTADLTTLGLPGEPVAEGRLGPARRCQWQASGSHGLDIAVMDYLGIDQVQSETPPEPLTVGSHDAVKVTGALEVCAVAIAVTDSSRVDMVGSANGDLNMACDLANQAAERVEPRLP